MQSTPRSTEMTLVELWPHPLKVTLNTVQMRNNWWWRFRMDPDLKHKPTSSLKAPAQPPQPPQSSTHHLLLKAPSPTVPFGSGLKPSTSLRRLSPTWGRGNRTPWARGRLFGRWLDPVYCPAKKCGSHWKYRWSPQQYKLLMNPRTENERHRIKRTICHRITR